MVTLTCACYSMSLSREVAFIRLPGRYSRQATYERFLILGVFIFSPLMTVDGSEILSQQIDVARPEFELTSPIKKSTEVRVVDQLS